MIYGVSMKRICGTFVFFLLAPCVVHAQSESTPSPVTVSGYLETYYVYDFNKPPVNTRPQFIYSYNRNNEVNLELGFVKVAYATEKVRANLALMAGTYTNANLASEPGVLKNIYEANAGIKLSRTRNLWIDAGVFASHIGFESAVGKDCWNLTRSILADNSPYYEAGAKVSYTTNNEKWFLSALILNGWQRIQRVEGNTLPSFGTQVTFKPTASVLLNSSSFIGTDKPDSARRMRYFHNFYGIFSLSKKLGMTIGFDCGVEEKSTSSSAMNSWYSPVAIVRWKTTDAFTVAVRGEYYRDSDGVIIHTGTPNGFRTTGISVNFDYTVTENAVWRLEVRQFRSKDPLFRGEHAVFRNDTFIATSLAISF